MESKKGLKAAMPEVAHLPIFKGLGAADLENLCDGGQIVISSHRDRLFAFGEPAPFFGFVLDGAYKLSRPTPLGEETIVHFATKGDFIAAFIMAQPAPVYPLSAYAMGTSRFVKIPRETFLTKWRQYPDLIFKIQSVLSSRMGQMHTQKALQKAPLSAKIAALLMELLERQPNESQLVLPLPLTRKEIADSLGASVESVIRIMSDWSKKGLIQTTDQNIQILKADEIISEISSQE